MSTFSDGPVSPCFTPVPFHGNERLDQLALDMRISEPMRQAAQFAPRGACVMWGIPFEVNDEVVLLADQPITLEPAPFVAGWLVFLHTSDSQPLASGAGGFISPMTGEGRLNELAAEYGVVYEDGSEARIAIRRRHQVGAFAHRWGEQCFQAVSGHKPFPVRSDQAQKFTDWGNAQPRVNGGDWAPWISWLFAWQNPYPEKVIRALRFDPAHCESGALVISGVSAGDVSAQPLRWRTRRKALFSLPEGMTFQPDLDANGLLAQIQLDLGAVISAQPRLVYPEAGWEGSYNNQLPAVAENEILVEYSAHPDACFHLWDGRVIPVEEVEKEPVDLPLQPVAPAARRINLSVVEKGSRKPVAVKLHVHGEWGEYLAPVDRHRIINPHWFEDYSVDFQHKWLHSCTYIDGQTTIDLPLGKVYVEASKGFEVRPVRTVFEITPQTEELVIEVEKALNWREKGWVTADTHVHFLSPGSALLEGAGEGVNVINLLASQWGELMTNVGDFDGKTTWGAGEYLVRVGTENRQHVLGHISLLGYSGRIIAPMTVGGPDESALGDPVDVLLTEWARQCHKQGGLVVLPHFPNPRAEHAASIISGDIDALEMTAWNEHYHGIDPYSLADWYRYLNCGYRVAAVAGTDKMSADMEVGTVRTYAHLAPGEPFTYAAWMDAVRRAETFVTYGPLVDFSVSGKPMGSKIELGAGGGTVDVTWQVESVTTPITRVELVVNGEIRESVAADSALAAGSWRVKVEKTSWLALLVRGHQPYQPEMIAAHTSPVIVQVPGTELLAAADAVTILEQIEGALAFIDTIGTRADDRAYKRIRLVLEGAHRSLHNRMHQAGHFHEHAS